MCAQCTWLIKSNFAGKRCSTRKWWSRKTCILFSWLHGNTKFASMGIWFKVQVWAFQTADHKSRSGRNCWRLARGRIPWCPLECYICFWHIRTWFLWKLVQKFSPWEVVRHDVVFPVRFFGHVEVQPDGS